MDSPGKQFNESFEFREATEEKITAELADEAIGFKSASEG
jgi:hypothetical protein